MRHPSPYESLYRDFDSTLMRRVRREAYGEDIGQHSWVSATEMRADIQRLNLTPESRVLDLGCGPCGPLTFILATAGCSGVGLERSPHALRAASSRANELGVESRLGLHEGDLDDPLPFDPASFDAAIALDVVLHLRDRAQFFREVARVVHPGGRFLLTDAGIVTGPLSSEDIRRRGVNGFTQLLAAGTNERLLEMAGWRLLETEDRTASVVTNASGRLAAMRVHRSALESQWGDGVFEVQEEYLETVIELSERGALARIMYLATR